MSARNVRAERDGRLHRGGLRRGRRRDGPRTRRRPASTVLVLEQGPRYTAADFKHDELDYWFNCAHHQQPAAPTRRLSARRRPRRPSASHGVPAAIYARMVGGSSTHFTANYWRFHEVDFKERSLLGPIAGTSFADWPIDYAELEPYYTKVEWEVGVSGLAGASPFDPPRVEALPDAAAAGEVLRRAARARRAQARPASVPGADGHRVGAVPRPARLRALRVLHRLRLRDAREVLDALHHDPRGRGHRPLRGAQRLLREPHRGRRARTASPASPTSTRTSASTSRRRARWWCARTAPRRRGCC